MKAVPVAAGAVLLWYKRFLFSVYNVHDQKRRNIMERKYKPIDWSKYEKLPRIDIGANPTCVFDKISNVADDREITLNHLAKNIFVNGAVKQ